LKDSLSNARRELFDSLNIPMNSASVRKLKRQARAKIVIWESYLRALLFLKRLMDIVVSATAMIIFSPLFLIVALLIAIEDWGPVFYTQTRVRQHGEEFKFYKFRSMFINADKMKDALLSENESGDGVIFKMKNDPRVTRIGRFIRKFSVDEMPQMLNVLKGDLALVGPRPPLPKEVAQYTLAERKRLNVKPGLTCLWQIKGRSDIPFDQQVELDLEYISSSGIINDILIMIKTVPAVLLGKGAY